MKVLLTATVTPKVAGHLHLADPAVRRQHYIGSLRRWVPLAAQLGTTVVLVENSGEDLQLLAEEALGAVPAHLRLLSAAVPTAKTVERGKGATEAAMMDLFSERCFEDPAEIWLKCTGRLFVSNFSRCVPAVLPQDPVVARVSVDLRSLDSRLFGTTAENWRTYFTGAGPEVYEPDDIPIEKVLMRRTLRAMGEGVDLVRFTTQPIFSGQSGTHAARRYDSRRRRLKRVATNAIDGLLKGPLKRKLY